MTTSNSLDQKLPYNIEIRDPIRLHESDYYRYLLDLAGMKNSDKPLRERIRALCQGYSDLKKENNELRKELRKSKKCKGCK